jgi:amidase
MVTIDDLSVVSGTNLRPKSGHHGNEYRTGRCVRYGSRYRRRFRGIDGGYMNRGGGQAEGPEFDRRTALSLAALAMGGVAVPILAAAKSPGADITGLDAVSLRRLIQARQLSCVEVMNAYLERIDALNPKVNAIVALQDRPSLIREAQVCDAQLARGEKTGPLHGFPHAVKDLTPVKGIAYTQGSPIFRDTIAASDALPAERLRRAGVIFIGKTNTPEFGLGSHTFNPVYGATRNAYDPTRSAGGSSGGAAVALALDMIPLADGSDYGGSLRNPAGWNNVYGFRTSIGRVPTHGKDDWLPSMGVTGPMARTVADLALLLSVQAGYDARAPLSMESAGDLFGGRLGANIKGKRIAWAGDFKGAVPYAPGVLDTCRQALKAFDALGCHVEEACPAYPIDKVWDTFVKLRGWQQGGAIAAYAADARTRSLLKPEALFEIEQGAKLSAYEVSALSAIRTEWSQAVRQFFERYDYWIMPTAQTFPFPVEDRWPASIAGTPMRTYHEWMKAVCLVTMSGCPALAAPAGFGPEGLPMGLQIIAPVHQELACLQLAFAYENASKAQQFRRSPLFTAS